MSGFWVITCLGMSMMDCVFVPFISSLIFWPMCLVVGERVFTQFGTEVLAAFKTWNQAGVFTQIGNWLTKAILLFGQEESLGIVF